MILVFDGPLRQAKQASRHARQVASASQKKGAFAVQRAISYNLERELEKLHRKRSYSRVSNDIGQRLSALQPVVPLNLAAYGISLVFASGEADVEIVRGMASSSTSTVLSTDADFILGFQTENATMVRSIPGSDRLQFYQKDNVVRCLNLTASTLLLVHFLQNKNDHSRPIPGIGFVTALKLLDGLNLPTTDVESFRTGLRSIFTSKLWKKHKKKDWSLDSRDSYEHQMLEDVESFINLNVNLEEGDLATELTNDEIDQQLLAAAGGLLRPRTRDPSKIWQYRVRNILPGISNIH